jgi:hypothetical protein
MSINQSPESQQIQPALMNRKCASRYLAISERKLWEMSKSNIIPVVRLGRAVRYDINDLNAFINNAKEGKL